MKVSALGTRDTKMRLHTAGIEVRESGHPKIQRNKIYGHESSGGVYVHHYGRAGSLSIWRGEFTCVRGFSVRTANAGLYATRKDTPIGPFTYSPPLSFCTMYSHSFSKQNADLEKNDIYHNSLSGITCWQSGKPICRHNRCLSPGLCSRFPQTLGHPIVAYSGSSSCQANL